MSNKKLSTVDYRNYLETNKKIKYLNNNKVVNSKLNNAVSLDDSYVDKVKNLRVRGYTNYVHECGRHLLNEKYVECDHINEITQNIDDLLNDRILNDDGEVIRCIYISIVSQSGKSTALSERLPLYVASNYGHNVLLATYNRDLSERMSMANKALAKDLKLELGLKLDSSVNRSMSWGIRRKVDNYRSRVQLQFTPFSSISGKQCDVMILDDIINTDDVYTLHMRDKVYHNYRSELGTRRPKYIIMIGTRYHKDDIYGRILDNEKGMWKEVIIPVFREGKLPLGWERGWDEDYWSKIKIRWGSNLWAINAMCDLTGGEEFKLSRSIFNENVYINYDIKDIYERIISVDGAQTLGGGDFTAFVACDVLKDGRIIILDIARYQVDMDSGYDLLNSFLHKYLTNDFHCRLVIENASSGFYWIPYLKNREGSAVKKYGRKLLFDKVDRTASGVYKGNKDMRYYHKLSGILEFGEFYFHSNCTLENREVLICELIDYGKERYDDTMDAFMSVLEGCYDYRLKCMVNSKN